MKKVGVVISSYNRGSKILPTVHSLLKQTHKIHKLVLIDDGSDVRRRIPKVNKSPISQIYLEQNVGVVWGRNLGISKCVDCEYVLLVDDDIVLDKDCLKELLMVFNKKKDCVASMPLVSFLSNKKRVWSSGSGVNLLTGQTIFFTNKPEDKYSEIPAATSILLVNMSVIKSTGWYDPLYYFCYEDADFYYRLRKKAGKIYCVSVAKAYHDIPENLSLDRVAKRSYHIARGRTIFLSRFGSHFILNMVFVLVFSLYYSFLGLKHKDALSGYRYFLGFVDGLFLSLKGGWKLSKEATFNASLSINEFTNPALLRKFKVRT